MKALFLASTLLFHPLYTVKDGDPKTCYGYFPETRGRKCCDKAYGNRAANKLITDEKEIEVLEECANRRAYRLAR